MLTLFLILMGLLGKKIVEFCVTKNPLLSRRSGNPACMGRAVLLLSHQHPEEEEEGQGTVTSHQFSSASVKTHPIISYDDTLKLQAWITRARKKRPSSLWLKQTKKSSRPVRFSEGCSGKSRERASSDANNVSSMM